MTVKARVQTPALGRNFSKVHNGDVKWKAKRRRVDRIKTLYESDGGGGFDGGLNSYTPNPYDFEQPSCKGCC